MPSPPNSSAIANSLIGVLLADPQLAALMPDGVYYDVARAGAKRFVIVSFVDGVDIATYDGRAIESALYLVKAVALASTGGNVEAAAERIDALLEDQFWTIAPGLELMTCFRSGNVLRTTEPDSTNPELYWNHRGGRYRLDVALTPYRTLGRLTGNEQNGRVTP